MTMIENDNVTPLVPFAPAQLSAVTPMAMLSQAVANGAPIEVIERLMALAKEMKADQSREAFNEAIAAAKAELKPAVKNREGHNSKRYADFSAYAEAVDPIISKHGLGYRFRTTQDERIHVTCILFHKSGHAEENQLSGPPDTTGSKNAIQAIGSTLTYLQRYSLIQALGLAASDDDNGKAAGIGEAISDEQIAQLQSIIVEVGANIQLFCKYMKVEALTDIPASQFQRAIAALEAKRAKS